MDFNLCDGPTSPAGKTKIPFILKATIDELLDKGMTFKEINKIMRLREKWGILRKEDK